jgi:predicted methyltransferase
MRVLAVALTLTLLGACEAPPRTPSAREESARWSPEMHSAAKALVNADYPTGRAAIAAAARGTHRKPGNAARDKHRHPVETLEVFGFTPTMAVLDVDPGEGWYTELLAPALASHGKLLTTLDTGGPHDEGRIIEGKRFTAFLQSAPELYGKVWTISIDSSAPSLGLNDEVDMVLLLREVHGMVNRRTFGAWLGEIRKALRPGGVLGVEDHRARRGADAAETAKSGYLPEQWTIDQIVAAGFDLVARSEVNANPRDTKDYPKGVWTLRRRTRWATLIERRTKPSARAIDSRSSS